MKRVLSLVVLSGLAVVLTACGSAGVSTPSSPSTPAIAAGQGYSLALKSDGTVWAWGANNSGQLGDGTSTSRSTPVQVVGAGGTGTLGSITAIAAGDHTLVLKGNGSVWAWGPNNSGQLGDGTSTSRSTPVQVVGAGGTRTLGSITAIAAGNDDSLALGSDGTVWAWGANSHGQLGNGTTNPSNTPVHVVGPGGTGTLASITAIAAGNGYSLALKSDGTVWAWGANSHGQLGNGTTNPSNTPEQVVGPGGTGTLASITAIAAGYGYSLALKSDGTVWAWGWNTVGQLGDGTTNPSNTPEQVVGPGGTGTLADVAAIAADDHSLALKSDGSVWAWGDNDHGEVGDGTTTARNAPVQVAGPGGAGALGSLVGIAAGGDHSLALKGSGSVWGWGWNGDGELGDGTTTNRSSPVQAGGLTLSAVDGSSLRGSP